MSKRTGVLFRVWEPFPSGIGVAAFVLIAFGALSFANAGESAGGTREEIGGPRSVDTFLAIEPEARWMGDTVCGCYILPGSIPSGYALHIFPDESAMLAFFSDIAATRLVASERWTLEKGVLRIFWTHRYPESAFEKDHIAEMEKSLTAFVQFWRKRSTPKQWRVLVPLGEAPNPEREYPQQLVAYEDWSKIKSGLEATLADRPK